MWDIHVHTVPESLIDGARTSHYGLTLSGEWIMADGQRVLAGGRMTSIGRLEAYAEQHQLSLVLSLPPALVRDRYPGSGWAAFANDSLLALKRRLTVPSDVLGVLPWMDMAASIQEWDRIGDQCLGVTVGGSMAGRSLSDPRHDAVWQHMAATGGGLVLVHGGEHTDPRLQRFYLSNLVGYPYEDTVAVADLVFSGLPVLYPQLQWCVSHGGGSAAFLLGRWQRGYDTQRPGIDTAKPSPREVFQYLWFDSVVHDLDALGFLMRQAPGRVVFGTDYPFPMGTEMHLESGVLPDELKAQLVENGQRLMKHIRKG